MGWFSDTFRGRSNAPPQQGFFENESDYEDRVRVEGSERVVEDATGSKPSQGIFESEADYRQRVSREADEKIVEKTSGNAPGQGLFENEQDYRDRVRREAREHTIEGAAGSRPSQGMFENEQDYLRRIEQEANEGIIEAAEGSKPSQGFFENERDYRARIRREANEARASRSYSSSSDTSETNWVQVVFGLFIIGVVIAAVVTPFLPIILLAIAANKVIGGGVGAIVGIILFAGAMFALWKFRHARAAYFFPYAFVLQALVFFSTTATGDWFAGALASLVVGSLLYRACFAAWRWRAEDGLRARAWIVASVAAVGSLSVTALIGLVRPSIGTEIAQLFDGGGRTRPPARAAIVENRPQAAATAPVVQPTLLPPASMLGQWINTDANTRGVTRIVITEDQDGMLVQAFGACSPTDCDWGVVRGRHSQSADALTLEAFYDPGFAQTSVALILRGDGSLMEFSSFTHFTDNSGRPDMSAQHTFVRAGPMPDQLAVVGPMTFSCDPSNCRDIWTTSVYSYAGGGGGPGGGLDDEKLRVGGWGDEYWSLIRFELPGDAPQAKRATLELYNRTLEMPTDMHLDVVVADWGWTAGDRLWWRDRPRSRPVARVGVSAQEGWVRIDITDLYNAWVRGDRPNYGLVLRPVSTNNNYNEFVSSNSPDGANHPRIVVE